MAESMTVARKARFDRSMDSNGGATNVVLRSRVNTKSRDTRRKGGTRRRENQDSAAVPMNVTSRHMDKNVFWLSRCYTVRYGNADTDPENDAFL